MPLTHAPLLTAVKKRKQFVSNQIVPEKSYLNKTTCVSVTLNIVGNLMLSCLGVVPISQDHATASFS